MMLCAYVLAAWVAQMPLQQAVQTALSHNESALLAAVNSQRAAAEQVQALSPLLPQVSVGGTLRHTLHGAAPMQMMGSVAPLAGSFADARVEQALVDVPAILYTVAAGERRQAAVLSQESERQQVALKAATLYLQADAWAAKAAAEAQRAQRATDHLALAQQRLAAALTGAHEVWVAEQELAEALQAQARCEQALYLALAELAQAVGSPVEGTEFPQALAAQACDSADSEAALQTLAQAQRPDVRALDGLVIASAQGERAANLRLLPTLSAQTQAFVPLHGELSWFVGASLRWQVFDGGTLLAEPALRAADHRAAVVQAEAGMRAVHNGVRGARAALGAVCTAQDQAVRQEAAANKRAAYTRERYAAGLEDVTAVKLATDEWARASVGLAQLRRDVLTALLSLRTAVGAPLLTWEDM